jgi:hypothetical protein
MFYLKSFFKFYLARKVFFLILFITTFLAFIFLINFNYIKGILATEVEHKNYMSLLVRDVASVDSLQHKLMQLPAVDDVKLVSKAKLGEEFSRVISELGELAPQSLQIDQYQLLKIYLVKNTTTASVDLLKQYLIRLLGSERVSISGPIQPNLTVKINSSVNEKYLYGTIFMMLFLWVICLIMVYPQFSSYCYLVEKFQRKKNVLLKSTCAGLTLIFIVSAIASTAFSPNFALGLIGLLAAMFLLVLVRRKRKWN